MNYIQNVGANCRFWMIVHTCVLTMSICWFADHVTGFNKCFGLVCQFLSLTSLLWVVSILDFPSFHGNSSNFTHRVNSDASFRTEENNDIVISSPTSKNIDFQKIPKFLIMSIFIYLYLVIIYL